MKLLSIADPEIWMLAGVSVLVVFAILLILVAVLLVFSKVAKKSSANKGNIQNTFVEKRQSVAADESDLNQAAVAMALSLYLTEKEERESHVLTITPTPDSAWGAKLNPRY